MDTFGTEYTTKLSVFTKLGPSTSFCVHRMQSSVAASWKKAKHATLIVKLTRVLAYNRFMGLMDHQLLSSTQQVYVTVTKVGQALAVKDILRCLDDGRNTKLNSTNMEFCIRRGWMIQNARRLVRFSRLFHVTLASQQAAAELLPWRHG